MSGLRLPIAVRIVIVMYCIFFLSKQYASIKTLKTKKNYHFDYSLLFEVNISREIFYFVIIFRGYIIFVQKLQNVLVIFLTV